MLSNICRRTASLHKLQKLVKTKSIATRNISTPSSSPPSNPFKSKLLVWGAVAGGVGLVVWRYSTTSENSKKIEEAVCEETDDEDDKKVMKKTSSDEKVDRCKGNGDDYERRLQDAIAKSRDLLYRAKDEYGTPGIVAAISVDGKPLWSEGLGYSDVENRVPCTSSAVLRVASISKSFTMVLAGMLMEAGKLDIDKDVRDYVPSFPEKNWEGEKVKITTRQLLSHLSGIRHYSKDYIKKQSKSKDNEPEKKPGTTKEDDKKTTKGKDAKIGKNAENVLKSITIGSEIQVTKDETSDMTINKDYKKMTDGERKGDERFKEFYGDGNYSDVMRAIDIFKDDPLVHKPGSKFLYTTYGWSLISAVLEVTGGRPFLKQMADIFRDLDMMNTVPDENIPLIYNRAKGYSHNKCGRLVNTPHVNLSLKWAGGGYLSTVDDLIKFGNAMLYSYQYTNKHKENHLPPGYLKSETMTTIWKPVPNTNGAWDVDSKYAMGWAVVDLDQDHGQCRKARHLVSHTGGAVGFSSVLLIVPPKDEESSTRIVGNKNGNDNGKKVDSPPPKGVVVAIVTNLGATSLYKTAVKIADIFKDL
ncbi:LOW QUALITY PROTEIN: serine beta-lactamase-like protein LACTB, mitochondrial [Amphiura filiformis]|uniref:LOW QUALITY PROTEIN: serine beta-lactamase-like protein LACTB, mitochondrial n=1 Tax=Amphiura filiformis TaxID=82378 RepID=UPI003B21A9B0